MDLHAPLDRKPPPRRRRLWPVVCALAGVSGLAGAGAYVLKSDPRGGEPYAVANIPPMPAPKTQPSDATPNATDPTPTGSLGKAKTEAADTVRYENGVKVVSPSDPDHAKARDEGPLVINVSKALDENARKVAATTQSKATTAQAKVAAQARRPRIAIFVSGLGLSDKATRTAVEIMPAAVSLAFLPYGDTLASSVGAAKARGHEILLQLPMESAKGPPPGPHTLSVQAPSVQTTADLNWMMARIDGYVGITNFLGAPVTSNGPALTTILKGVHDRGVFYLDDGTSKRTLVMALAPSLGVPAAQADVVLDATGDPAVVRTNLERLAAVAQKKGWAIGMTSAFGDHLATVARFAAELDSRGFVLVPVSTLVQTSTNTATSR